jgi:RNA polymerase sigma factor (sigma-70 family)
MDRTSLTLLARVQADEPAAWERFVELYAPLVHHWCRRAELGAETTADVFQDVFQAVAQHIGGFRRDRPGDTLRGWLRTVTANKIRDHYRRHADEPAAQGGTTARLLLQEVADPLGEGDDEETGVMWWSVASVLEDADRRAIARRRGRGAEHDAGRGPQSQVPRAPAVARGTGRARGVRGVGTDDEGQRYSRDAAAF